MEQIDGATFLEMFKNDFAGLDDLSPDNLKAVAIFRLSLWKKRPTLTAMFKKTWQNAFVEAVDVSRKEVAAGAFASAWSEVFPGPAENEADEVPDKMTALPDNPELLDVESYMIEIEDIFGAIGCTAEDVFELLSTDDLTLCRDELRTRCQMLLTLHRSYLYTHQTYREKFGI
ncbi:MAG: hypothetical protein AB1403_16635 [Candidatus Riflebacteria bacterium]